MSTPVIAVLGASGFIGRAVVRALAKLEGVAVRRHAGPCGPSGDGETVFELTDTKALDVFFAGTTAVIHAAGPPDVGEAERAPMVALAAHVTGTAVVAERAALAGSHLVYVSSSKVSAPTESVYAEAKLAAETVVRAWGRVLPVTIARPTQVYGPGGSPRTLVVDLVGLVLEGGEVRPRDPAAQVDLVYVDDVARSLVAAALNPPPPHEVRIVEVRSGHTTRAAQVARHLRKLHRGGLAPELPCHGPTPLVVGLARTLAAARAASHMPTTEMSR